MVVSSRIANHPVVATLNQFEDVLRNAEATFPGQQPDLIERGRMMAKVLRDRLDDSAADLVSDTALSNSLNWTQQAMNELQQAVNTGSLQYLVQTGGYINAIDAFSQNLGQFPVTYPTDALAGQLDEAQRRVNVIQEIQIKAAADARSEQDRRGGEYEQQKREMDEQIAEATRQRLAAENLLAALGGQATAKGYSDTADAERSSADAWRRNTSILAGVTIVAAVALFAVVQAPGYESYLRRAGVLLPLVLFTIYAGRQSAEHRKEEREARRLQLSFASVSAYLLDLDDANRAVLKAQLSSQLFGSSTSATVEDDKATFPTTVELVRTIMESATRGRS